MGWPVPSFRWAPGPAWDGVTHLKVVMSTPSESTTQGQARDTLVLQGMGREEQAQPWEALRKGRQHSLILHWSPGGADRNIPMTEVAEA